MNYPHIFERVYCTPIAVTAEGFRAIDAILRPRLLGKVAMPNEETIAKFIPPREAVNAKGRKSRPRATMSADGKSVVDARLYGLAAPGLAVIPAKGIMARNVSAFEEACFGMTGYESIAAALDQADAADEVQEMILDADTPGGECNGCFELADKIAALSKPIYGFTEGMACSAGECLISQCDENYNTRTAMRGSIGVICSVLDDTANLAEEGYKMEYFTAGANKLAFGGSGYALNDSDRAVIQNRVDTFYGMFADAVQRSRGAVEPLAAKSARVYVGEEAETAGLSDGVVSGFDELVSLILDARAASLAEDAAA